MGRQPEIHVYEDIDTIGFWRVIMRNGINVNDDGESVEKRSSWISPSSASAKEWFDPTLFSMWNVPGTESILKHCFNGQEHKSLSDTENNRQQQSQNRIRTHYGLLVLRN